MNSVNLQRTHSSKESLRAAGDRTRIHTLSLAKDLIKTYTKQAQAQNCLLELDPNSANMTIKTQAWVPPLLARIVDHTIQATNTGGLIKIYIEPVDKSARFFVYSSTCIPLYQLTALPICQKSEPDFEVNASIYADDNWLKKQLTTHASTYVGTVTILTTE